MGSDPFHGFDGLRQRQAEQGELLARVDERSKAQGREITEMKITLHDVDGKVDGILNELATGHGQIAQKKSTTTGVKDVITVLAAVSGVAAAIVIGLLK